MIFNNSRQIKFDIFYMDNFKITEYWTPIDGVHRIEFIDSNGWVNGYGLIKNSVIITKYVYQQIICFDSTANLAACERNNKWGFLDINGNEIVPCELEYVSDTFYCGLAEVRKYGKCGFMNTQGILEHSYVYDEVSLFWDNIATVRKGNKWGAITTKSSTGYIFPCSYDKLYVLGSGIIVAGKKSMLGFGPIKFALYDYRCHQITDYKYDAIGNTVLSNGTIMYKKGTERGYIDKNGHEIITFG